ncbi:MAG: Hpt domain-containing protein, partial [Polyangiaceae bacterium]
MSSSASDPELLRLLLLELQRHLVTLEAEPRDLAGVQRAVHALKGSAGLAGERELAATLERLHRRVKEADESAFAEASALVRTAVQRLGAGESAVAARWPIPPDDLAGRPLDPLVLAQYAAEVTDRLARIDDALSTGGDPLEAVRNVYRHLHTMKGAASAVGDEPMSWLCHG